MNAIRLRAHHLGIIYNVVAGGEDAMETLHRGLVSTGYPPSTIAIVQALIERVFLGKCSVEIVKGPDVVCTSGCLKTMESDYSGNFFERSMFDFLCLNRSSVTDTAMMYIFGVTAGERYSSNAVISKARVLWRKHQFTDWKDLVDKFFYKEHREEFGRLYEESKSVEQSVV